MSSLNRWLRTRQRQALPVIGAVPVAATTFVQDIRDGRVLPIARDITEADTLLLVGAFGDHAVAAVRQLRQRMVAGGVVVWLAPEEHLLGGAVWSSSDVNVVVRGLPPTEADLERAWRQLDGAS